jgi:hypothetical protein
LSPGKFTLERRIAYPHQRSGWAYALRSLDPLLRQDGQGVILDSMVEHNFARELASARREGRIPYRRPWVGFLHIPPGVPEWLDWRKSPLHIFQLAEWRESLPYCRGLVVLSEWMRAWLEPRVEVPVLALKHPTSPADVRFDFGEFLRAGAPVVQVGWWLRRLTSIHELPLPASRKRLLIPHEGPGLARFLEALESERRRNSAPTLDEWAARILPRLPDDEYDRLLASSLIFVHLHDSAANNAIVECLVRGTPLLVNPLPSVREYVGEDYPLYFTSLEEAARKASDLDLVHDAHRFLAGKDFAFLSGTAFCRAFRESALYGSL